MTSRCISRLTSSHTIFRTQTSRHREAKLIRLIQRCRFDRLKPQSLPRDSPESFRECTDRERLAGLFPPALMIKILQEIAARALASPVELESLGVGHAFLLCLCRTDDSSHRALRARTADSPYAHSR